MFLGCKKNFDTIIYARSIKNLNNAVFPRNFLRLIENSLDNCHLYVKIISVSSKIRKYDFGDPQGSMFGPNSLKYSSDFTECVEKITLF